jgi:hypothetical protein
VLRLVVCRPEREKSFAPFWWTVFIYEETVSCNVRSAALRQSVGVDWPSISASQRALDAQPHHHLGTDPGARAGDAPAGSSAHRGRRSSAARPRTPPHPRPVCAPPAPRTAQARSWRDRTRTQEPDAKRGLGVPLAPAEPGTILIVKTASLPKLSTLGRKGFALLR